MDLWVLFFPSPFYLSKWRHTHSVTQAKNLGKILNSPFSFITYNQSSSNPTLVELRESDLSYWEVFNHPWWLSGCRKMHPREDSPSITGLVLLSEKTLLIFYGVYLHQSCYVFMKPCLILVITNIVGHIWILGWNNCWRHLNCSDSKALLAFEFEK